MTSKAVTKRVGSQGTAVMKGDPSGQTLIVYGMSAE